MAASDDPALVDQDGTNRDAAFLATLLRLANGRAQEIVHEEDYRYNGLLSLSRIFSVTAAAALLLAGAAQLHGQGGQTPLTVLSRDGRRTIPIALVNSREFVALDDLAATFQLTVREESGAITVSYKGRTIVLTPDQALASVAGRLISLPARPARIGARWLVPVEFISRVLAPFYDVRLDLRTNTHLVVIGDLRIPRVTIR
jgi:hypothetical protein